MDGTPYITYSFRSTVSHFKFGAVILIYNEMHVSYLILNYPRIMYLQAVIQLKLNRRQETL